MSGYRYQERRFFSIILGCKAARISVPDANRDEHYAIVPMNGTGRENRELRYRVLEQLVKHVDQGFEPGEVDVDMTPPKLELELEAD